MGLSRRELIERCAATGVLVAGLCRAGRVWAAPGHAATPPCELGPFYKRGAPGQSRLRGERDPGMPLKLSGKIYDTRGDLVPGATVELWHADAAGHYDLDGDRFRATLRAVAGGYEVETVMPGHYPGRVCQHVHYVVRADGHRPLVTQLFFATDPAFAGDPARNFARDPLIPSVELVRPVTLAGDDRPVATVTFDLVLERA